MNKVNNGLRLDIFRERSGSIKSLQSTKRKAERAVDNEPNKKAKIENTFFEGVLTRSRAHKSTLAKIAIEEKELFNALNYAKLCFTEKKYKEAEKKTRIVIENSRFLQKPEVELYYILSLSCFIQKKFEDVDNVLKDALGLKSFSSDEQGVFREILRLAQFERDQCDEEKYMDEIIMDFPSMEWHNRAKLHCVLFDIIYSCSKYRASVGILHALRYVQYINDKHLRNQVFDRLNKYEDLKLVEEHLSFLKESEKCDISSKYLSDALDVLKLVNTNRFYFH